MKVCILGWYGTETLGDRAILAGIFKLMNNFKEVQKIRIGSLYPFYSERTELEEHDYYSSIINNFKYSFFNVKDKAQLKIEIEEADLIIMGGGPIMDMYELELIYQGFKYAKKKKKKTALFGCGVETSSNTKFYNQYVRNICKYADIIIVRDFWSKKVLELLKIKKKIYVCYDPAFLGVDTHVNYEKGNYAVVNLRDCSFKFDDNNMNKITTYIIELLNVLCDSFQKVYLMSNHTFFLGGDDRDYYAKIIKNIKRENLMVLNKPLSLTDTFSVIKGAKICFGMRYHAVLFQTLLNGNNYILDYTEPESRKMKGFLNIIPNGSFYQERYINMIQLDKKFGDFESKEKYKIEERFFDKIFEQYINILYKERIFNE